MDFHIGNRRNGRTCTLTLVPVCAAELPSTGAGALVGRVAWFAELAAALALFQGAQSLVCIVETEGEGCSTRTPNEKRINNDANADISSSPFSQWIPVKPDLQTQS